jgi:M6 family metalloprotease-like protein
MIMKTKSTRAIFLLLCLLFTGGWKVRGQDSQHGYWLPVKGTIRIFLVYAEALNDPDDPGWTEGWEPGQLPRNPGWFFDHQLKPGEQAMGILTKYYQQASFGEFILLADYYPKLISVDFNNMKGRGFQQVMDTIIRQTGEDVITANGYSTNAGDFDAFTRGSGHGKPKTSKPDSLLDMVMVIWRVNSKITKSSSGGYCMPYHMSYPFKSMKGFMAYSYFVNEGAANYVILRHEFSHLLLGGNNFHTGGSGAGTKTFMSSAGGYAMLSSWNRSSQVYNAFDRRRLGWKSPENLYQISARDPATGKEIGGDLAYQQAFSHGGNEFIIRDFVNTGDAIRIELPYLQKPSQGISKQWLWLENHQILPGNLDHSDVQKQGIHAYVQVGKETLAGRGTYAGNANYTWPLSAMGNFDWKIDEASELYRVSDALENPFTGYNNLIMGAWDLKKKDGVILRDELFFARNMQMNGGFLDSSFYCLETYPIFGTALDAFVPGDRIGIDQNPAAVTLLTYRTSSSGRGRPGDPSTSDNRIIHLNGLVVDVIEQLEDGSIRVRISWEENRLRSDVRWCGTIHLHEHLEMEKNVRLLLDQGLTPQKPKDPILFKGQQVFADASSLVLQPGSSLALGKKSTLLIDNGSTLVLMEGSEIEIGRRASIILEPTAKIRVMKGATIKGKGKIILNQGASTDLAAGSTINVKFK